MREVVTRWRSGWNLATARLHAPSTSFAVPACANVHHPMHQASNDRPTAETACAPTGRCAHPDFHLQLDEQRRQRTLRRKQARIGQASLGHLRTHASAYCLALLLVLSGLLMPPTPASELLQ